MENSGGGVGLTSPGAGVWAQSEGGGGGGLWSDPPWDLTVRCSWLLISSVR